MNAPEPLVLDLVEWIARKPRPLDDVMEAWRTSCPRLPVWEDAVDRGLVTRESADKKGRIVRVSEKGLALLKSHGRLATDA
jgi:hypothetical protein